MINKLTSTLIMLFLAAAATLVSPSTAAAASCYAARCQGRDPQVMGCWRDAKTIGISPLPGTAAAGWNEVVELRYSKICGTQWARVNSQSAVGILYITAYHAANSTLTRVTRLNTTLAWSNMTVSTQDTDGACGSVVLWSDTSYNPVHCVNANLVK